MGRAWVFIIAATIWLAACSEGIGPPPAPELRHLRWSPTIEPPSFAVVGGQPVVRGPNTAAGLSASPILDTYQTSFWAHRGRDEAVEIRYRAPDGTWQPFARLSIPASGLYRRPDGQLFGDGDSVLIAVTLDPKLITVEFQPTGLVFSSSAPAQFNLWYTGADPDLDANGTLNGVDEQIRRTKLTVWVQESASEPWARVSAQHSLDDKLFTAGLRHFSKYLSGYAVSF